MMNEEEWRLLLSSATVATITLYGHTAVTVMQHTYVASQHIVDIYGIEKITQILYKILLLLRNVILT